MMVRNISKRAVYRSCARPANPSTRNFRLPKNVDRFVGQRLVVIDEFARHSQSLDYSILETLRQHRSHTEPRYATQSVSDFA